MKTMADKLKELLASQTKEEFLKDWEEIEAFGFEGPVASDYLTFIQDKSSITQPNEGVHFSSDWMGNELGYNSPDYSQAA